MKYRSPSLSYCNAQKDKKKKKKALQLAIVIINLYKLVHSWLYISHLEAGSMKIVIDTLCTCYTRIYNKRCKQPGF